MWTSASSQTDLPVYSYLLSCPCVSTAFLCSHTKSDPLITFTSLLFDCDINHLFSFILAWSLLYLCISFLCFHVDILQRECFLDLARTLRLLCTTSQCCQEWGERDSLASKKKGMVPGPKMWGIFRHCSLAQGPCWAFLYVDHFLSCILLLLILVTHGLFSRSFKFGEYHSKTRTRI